MLTWLHQFLSIMQLASEFRNVCTAQDQAFYARPVGNVGSLPARTPPIAIGRAERHQQQQHENRENPPVERFARRRAELARDRRYINRFLSRTRKDGYASSVGETEQGISAIAVPIGGVGPVIGSLNIVFFTSAMTTEVAARRYLRSLKQAASDIERRWRMRGDLE